MRKGIILEMSLVATVTSEPADKAWRSKTGAEHGLFLNPLSYLSGVRAPPEPPEPRPLGSFGTGISIGVF